MQPRPNFPRIIKRGEQRRSRHGFVRAQSGPIPEKKHGGAPSGAVSIWFFPSRASTICRKYSEYTGGRPVGVLSRAAVMNYCILRAAKLNSFGSIAASAMHTFREIPTPNANEDRTHLNRTSGANTSVAVRAAVASALPAKRRKDAVLCIEYLITASPEWFLTSSAKAHQDYFNEAVAWLRRRHGQHNIVCLNLQLDEKSPHLVAYVVPLTMDGRLSAKDYLGGRQKLRAMQTDFWNMVGRPAGLERGLEGSTAKHATAKQYSAALALNPKLEPPAPPAPTFADRVTGRARQMHEKYRAEVDAHAQLVEQARTEALMGKKGREQQGRALAKLRDQVSELDGAKSEVERLAAENRKLALELDRRRKYFDNQMAAVKAQLDESAAKAKVLQPEVVFWRRRAEATRAEADELRELLCPATEREELFPRQGG